MNWLRENRLLGNFLIVVGVGLVGAAGLLLRARSDWDGAAIRFSETAAELKRLEQLAPYPSDENLRAMKAHADDYANALVRLQSELKARVIPLPQIAPNEFQSRLRLATIAVTDKAREKKVKLPDKFHLGFDEFASSLPDEAAAPLLGHELGRIEWLLDALLESRVEAVTSFRRVPLPAEHRTASPQSTPATGKSELFERRVVEAIFVSTPAAARRVLNQIVGANQEFFIVRLLRVRNEKDKGPPREVNMETMRTAASPPALTGSAEAKVSTAAALNFIVGNERIEITAKIEIVRFLF